MNRKSFLQTLAVTLAAGNLFNLKNLFASTLHKSAPPVTTPADIEAVRGKVRMEQLRAMIEERRMGFIWCYFKDITQSTPTFPYYGMRQAHPHDRCSCGKKVFQHPTRHRLPLLCTTAAGECSVSPYFNDYNRRISL